MSKKTEKYLIAGEKEKWEVIIGLEIHAQVTSSSKLFSGASTKFVRPFELTKLFEGAADYVGYARKAPDRQLSEVKDIEKALGKSEDVLGTIPTADEMQAELDAIKEEADEALQQVVDEGIKDQMTASQPPKELKEPEA